MLFWWQSPLKEDRSSGSSTGSLISGQATESDTQTEALPYGDCKLDGHVCVCPSRLCKAIIVTVQERSKCKGWIYAKQNSHRYVKLNPLCSNVTQNICHFIDPDSDFGFNTP
jgi:hypothetical protein